VDEIRASLPWNCPAKKRRDSKRTQVERVTTRMFRFRLHALWPINFENCNNDAVVQDPKIDRHWVWRLKLLRTLEYSITPLSALHPLAATFASKDNQQRQNRQKFSSYVGKAKDQPTLIIEGKRSRRQSQDTGAIRNHDPNNSGCKYSSVETNNRGSKNEDKEKKKTKKK